VNRTLSGVALLVLVSMCCVAQEDCQPATEDLARGVQAFKEGKYDAALTAFTRATKSAPRCTRAWLYVGTSNAALYASRSSDPKSQKNAEIAIQAFEACLAINPKQIDALRGLGDLKFRMRQWEAAKEIFSKAAEVDPNDPEISYYLAVIDWTEAYQRRMELRSKLKLEATDDLTAIAPCHELRKQNWDLVDDGMTKLASAIQLRPDYDDAMAYMNLMYRERADIQCDDPGLRKKDKDTADGWVDLTIATKRHKAQPAPDPPRSEN
jgi:tetratricopeptide (TPR) repeat protein